MLRRNPTGHMPQVSSTAFIDLTAHFHVPPMTNIGVDFDLDSISKVPPEYSAFSESVVSANHELVQGYRRIVNEL